MSSNNFEQSFDDDYQWTSMESSGTNYNRKSFTVLDFDNMRVKKLSKIALLPIPQLSIDILSKLTISHQLKEIIKVLQVKDNCVTLQAQFNLSSESYHQLDSNDVIVKIFTQKNHTKPDIEAARLYSVINISEKKKVGIEEKKYFYQRLPVLCIGNVAIVKMIGYEDSALKSWRTKIEDPKKLDEVFQKLLKLVKEFKDRDDLCWGIEKNRKSILKHNKKWIVEQTWCYKHRKYQHVKNFSSIVTVFRYYGVSWKQLKDTFNVVYEGKRYGWDHVICFLLKKEPWEFRSNSSRWIKHCQDSSCSFMFYNSAATKNSDF